MCGEFVLKDGVEGEEWTPRGVEKAEGMADVETVRDVEEGRGAARGTRGAC